MKKILSLLLALMMVFALVSCGSSTTTTTTTSGTASSTDDASTDEDAAEYADVDSLSILFSTTFSESETGGLIIAHFAEYLSEITDGQITVNVKYGGTVADSSLELEAVSSGSVNMVALGHNPHADVLSYLCAFPDFAPGSTQAALDYFNYMLFENEETAAILEAEATENNIKYLNVIAGGANVFISKTEFSDLDSMVANSSAFGNMAGAKFAYLGFTVVEMYPFDMYDSFDRGLVDTTQMGFAPCVSMAIYEVAQYWMLDNTYTAGNFFTVNLDWWNDLTEGQQEAIQAAADEVMAYSATIYDEAIESDMATVVEGGGTFITMNDEDTAIWWEAVFESAVADVDLSDANMVAIFQAAAEATGYDWSYEG